MQLGTKFHSEQDQVENFLMDRADETSWDLTIQGNKWFGKHRIGKAAKV